MIKWPLVHKALLASMAVAVAIVGSSIVSDGSHAAAANLIGHWTFDDGTGTDSSGNGNDGVVNGALLVPGTIGLGALDFDGIDDYVDAGNIDVPGSALTFAAWINADNLANCGSRDCRIASKATGVRTADHYIMLSTIRRGGGVNLRFRLKAGGSTSTLVAPTGNIIEGQWMHVAATYDGADMRIYLDGVEVGLTQKTGAIDVNPAVPFWIGGNPPSSTVRPWDGKIDDARLYDRTLSPTEIQTLAVGIVNDPPVGVPDGYVVDEDDVLTVLAPGVLGNDTDTETDPLSAQLVSGPVNGALNLLADGSFVYTPDPDFNGPDSFMYTASDSQGSSAPTDVTITVNPINDRPVADPQLVQLINDAPAPITLTGDDVDGDTLTFAVTVPPANGTLSGTAPLLSYTADTGYVGSDSFTFETNDTLLSSLGAVVQLDVIAPNDPPIGVPDPYSIDEDAVLTVLPIGVLANDTDTEFDPLTAQQVSGPVNGTLNLSPDGSFIYTPDPNFNGQDSFVYTAHDPFQSSAPTDVIITVDPINDQPVADSQSVSTRIETPLAITLTATDIDGEPLTYSASVPGNGSLSGTAPDLTYTPNPGFEGTDSFTFTASDAVGPSLPATVSILVFTDNSAPRIVTGEIVFSRQVVATDVNQVHAVVGADFTGDGEIDMVATDYIDNMVFWFENDGAGGFISRVLDPNLVGAYPANVGDVDGDGDVDILAAGYLVDTYRWYENDGTGSFTTHDIDIAANGAHSIVVVDLDDDGDQDLVTSEQDASRISWYENDGSQNFTRFTIDNAALAAKRAEVVDFDGDGDIDVYTASFDDDTVAWYENDGSQNFTKRVVTTTADGAYHVASADIDNDGDLDLFSASQLDGQIAWYRNDGLSGFTKLTVDSNTPGARSVTAVDIDRDGNIDALSASVDDDSVAWHKNDGAGGFTRHEVDYTANGAYAIFSVDMNHDGSPDVLSGHRISGTVAVHIQTWVHSSFVLFGNETNINTSMLQAVDVDDGPSQLTYTLTAPPIHGDLAIDGVPITTGTTFTQDDIDTGRLSYIHAGISTLTDNFGFTVADGGEGGLLPAKSTFSLVPTGTGGEPNINDGLVGYWTFDDGTGTDSSGAGNNGVVNGALPTAGRVGPGALDFDGIDDHVDAGNIDVTGDAFSLTVWINPDNLANCGASLDCRIASKASGVGTQDHYYMISTINSNGPKLRFRLKTGGSTQTLIATSGTVVEGQWMHVAATYDGVNMRLFLDGVEVGIVGKTGTLDVNPTLPFWIGANPLVATIRPWDGKIDDVRLYERALSASEIQGLASGHSITTQTLGSGSVTLNPDLPAYDTADVVQLTAVADAGWTFDSWAGDATGSTNPVDVTVTGNMNITAVFVDDPNAHTVTLATSGPGSVVISPVQQFYATGDIVQLTATPTAPGWAFGSWLGGLTGSVNPANVTVNSDLNITAVFVDDPNTHIVTVTTTGQGSVTKTPDQALYTNGDIVQLTATPATGWVFNSWLGGQTGNVNPVDVTVNSDLNITAVFVDDPNTHTVTVATTGQGSVTKTPDLALYTNGDVVQLNATPAAGWLFDSWSGGQTGNTNPVNLTVTSNLNVTALFTPLSVGETVFDIFYGDIQKFNNVGRPQVWASVLGNVSDADGLSSLTYTLNGGALQNLSIGSDSRRLWFVGDFNVELDFDDLVVGMNEVIITATDTNSNVAHKTVFVDYAGRNVWPINYSIDWSTVTDIQDAVQIIDGDWTLGPDGLTTIGNSGYDRLFGIGDLDWTDYAIEFDVTIHGETTNYGAFGLAMRWRGHTNTPFCTVQPHCGWVPYGHGMFYDWTPTGGVSIDFEGDTSLQDSSGMVLLPDVTYTFKLEVENLPDGTTIARKKFWVAGQAEPSGWLKEGNNSKHLMLDGSFLFVAHHVELTVGDITVSQIVAGPDITPPLRSAGAPTGELPSGTTQASLSLNTDEAANCRYSPVPGTAFASMTDLFSVTGGTAHSTPVNGLVDGQSYDFYVRCEDGDLNSNTVDFQISFSVAVFVPDTTPPVRSNGAPIGVLPSGTTQATISLDTDEAASCRYGTVPGIAFASLPNIFTTTGSTAHSTQVSGLADGQAFDFYVRCEDGDLNENIDDFSISFSVSDPNINLIGHWTFDDGTATDISGNGNDGVVNGAVLSPGHIGVGALDFDGLNDHVNVGNIDVPGTALTFAVWINADNLANCASQDCRIASKAIGVNTPDHYIMLSTINSGGPKLRFRLKAGGSTSTLIGSGGTVVNGQWMHVAATYDGADMRLYLDGIEVGLLAKSGAIDVNPAVPFWLGGNPPSATVRPWDGKIDDARLYDRTLTPAEIQVLAGQTPPSDTQEPWRTGGFPGGLLPPGTTQTTLSLNTLEDATCRYDTVAGTAFASMPNVFSATGGTAHSTLVTGLADGQAYSFYVRCEDQALNANTTDTVLAFPVAVSVDAPAPTATFVGSNPQAVLQSTHRGKQISTLFEHDDKLYMGYGDWQSNNGPIHIVHYDPLTDLFVDEFTFSTESVQNYREIDGTLYVSSIDPRSPADPDIAVRAPDGTWSTLRPAGLVHSFDVNTLTGTDIWLVGASDPNGEVYRSIDGGATWTQELQFLPSTTFTRVFFAGVLNNKLYVEPWFGIDTSSKVFDGTTWTDGPDLLDAGETGWRSEEFAGNMFFRTQQHPELPNHLRRFDGTTSQITISNIRDFVVDGIRLYVLADDGTIHYTEDGTTYSTFSAATNSSYRSIGVLNGVVYVGTSTGDLYRF